MLDALQGCVGRLLVSNHSSALSLPRALPYLPVARSHLLRSLAGAFHDLRHQCQAPVTTSVAPVTTSVALVPSSFLLQH